MNRQSLLDTLARVSPALSSNELVPILTNYWFDGETVMAHNDQIAISAICKTDFTGALPGKMLTNLLEKSRAKELTITGDGAGVKIKAASANMALVMRPAKDFLMTMPEPKGDGLPVKKRAQLLAALECCAHSISDDASRPEQNGIMLLPDGDYVVAYATDNATLSRADIALTSKAKLPKGGAILPGDFCRLVTRYLAGEGKYHFEVNSDYALFTSGTMSIWGRLINPPAVIDFDGILAKHFPDERQADAVKIPTKLRSVLEQACVIINTKQDSRLRTTIKVTKGVADFTSRNDMGEVHDTMQLPDHPDVTVSMDPKLMLDAFAFYEEGKMLLMETCAVFTRGAMTFLAASYTG